MHAQNLRRNVIHRSTSYETVRSMVARGFGYSLFFQETHTQLSYEGLRIVDVRINPPLASEPVALSHNPSPPCESGEAVAYGHVRNSTGLITTSQLKIRRRKTGTEPWSIYFGPRANLLHEAQKKPNEPFSGVLTWR